MTQPVFEITKAATFDAAHHFPNEPEGSPYRRIHGHSFQVEVSIRSDRLDANGWVADLNALDTALKAAAGHRRSSTAAYRPGTISAIVRSPASSRARICASRSSRCAL